MRLPNIFYAMPACANTTMTRKDVKALLLDTGGWVMACGHNWDIVPKHIGAGVYKVTLKRRNASAGKG